MDLAAEFQQMKAGLMAYCVIGEPISVDDDAELYECFLSAVSYMQEAGVSLPDADKDPLRRAKYNRCLKALVLDEWDNRGTQVSSSSVTDNPSWQRKKNQLKWTEPVSDSDTGLGG